MWKYFVIFVFFISGFSDAKNSFLIEPSLLELNGITEEKFKLAIEENIPPSGDFTATVIINNIFIKDAHAFYSPTDGLYVREADFLGSFKFDPSSRNRKKIRGVEYFLLKDKNSYHFRRSTNEIVLKDYAYGINIINLPKKLSGGVGGFVNYDSSLYNHKSKTSANNSQSVNYEFGTNFDNYIVRGHGFYRDSDSGHRVRRDHRLRDIYVDKDYGSNTIKVGRVNPPGAGFGIGYMDGAIINIGNNSGNPVDGVIDVSFYSNQKIEVQLFQNGTMFYSRFVDQGDVDLNGVPVISWNYDVIMQLRKGEEIIDSKVISKALIKRVNGKNLNYYLYAGKNTYSGEKVVGGIAQKSINNWLNPELSVLKSEHYSGFSLRNDNEKNELYNSESLLVSSKNRSFGYAFTHSSSFQNSYASITYQSPDYTTIDSYYGERSNQMKYNISAGYNISFKDMSMLSLSASRYGFYSADVINSISLGYSGSVRGISFTSSLSYMPINSYSMIRDNISVNAGINIPFSIWAGRGNNRTWFSKYNGTTRMSNTVNAPISENISLSYDHDITRNSSEMSISDTFNVSGSSPYTKYSSSVSKQRDGYSRVTASSLFLSGAIAANAEGVVFSANHIGDTYSIVNTGIHEFVKVESNRSNATTNHDGKAIIPQLLTDGENYIKVNPKGLPHGAVVENNRRVFITKRGAVSYFKFNIKDKRNNLYNLVKKPDFIERNTIFYSGAGDAVAGFVDDNVLLVNSDNLNLINKNGMRLSSKSEVVCHLIEDRSFHKHQEIDERILECK